MSRVIERVHVVCRRCLFCRGFSIGMELGEPGDCIGVSRVAERVLACCRVLLYLEEIHLVRADGVTPVGSVSMMLPGAIPLESELVGHGRMACLPLGVCPVGGAGRSLIIMKLNGCGRMACLSLGACP